MSTVPTLRASAEMRAYLIEQLNHVLRRPEMYSTDAESALWMMFDHLAHLEAADSERWWPQLRDKWGSRGAFTPTGVAGAFRRLLPGDVTSAVASLFGEEARTLGWLTTDRTLSVGEYENARGSLATWAQHDRSHSEVLDAFGPPSVWFGSRQPRLGKVLGYFSERPEDPAIVIHMWNKDRYDAARDDQAPVIAVRCGHGPLSSTFVFTPEGARTRPAPR